MSSPTVASWPPFRFLRRLVRWSGIPNSFRIFHSLLWSTQSKCKKAKRSSEEGLQIVEKRIDATGKGEKERYTHLNAEFQGIASSDKKAFLSYQCKEIEENNRMGKTRDLFKKIRDIKGTFHAVMGTIKDRNGLDLTEAEDIKKRWEEYTELYKKSWL